MSQTDRAFIKAYGSQLPPTAPFLRSQATDATAEDTVIPDSAASQAAAPAEPRESNSEEAAKNFTLRADQPAERLPVPHLDRLLVARTKESEVPADPEWEDLITAEEKRILTGEVPIAQSEATENVEEVEEEQEDMETATASLPKSTALRSLSESVNAASGWNPQQKVDHFQFPAVCNALLQVCQQDFEALAESFEEYSQQGNRLIAINSVQGNEGCTTFTLCLASTLAARGQRVLVVDHDLGQPAIAQALGLTLQCGWDEVICEDASLSEAVILEADSNLAVLPARSAQESAVPSVPRQRLCFALMRQHYDLILVDAGPLRSLSDEQLRAPQFDAAIVVRDPQGEQETLLQADLLRWQRIGVSVLGIVETFVPRSPLAVSA